jgi:vitamin B12 transporter
VPGSVYYPSEDRQKDRNAFVQGCLRKRFSQVYALQVSAKVSYDDLSYISTWGDSSYGQTETQLNSSHEFNVAEWCRLSLAADLQWDAIKSDQYDEERLTLITAAAAMFRVKGFTSKLTLEYNGVADPGKRSIHLFSPAFDMKLMICDGLDLTGYVRRANRVPVFNELYYPGYGNPDLNTEKAWLADLGVDYRRSFAPHWSLRVMADLFYNSLRDKIISAPSADDPNIWRPYNIGKVLSHGSDISAGVKYTCRFIFSAEVKYSYVNAVDRTPESPDYGKRLPYVAGHSLMCSADASLRGWRAGVIWQLRDGRYDSYGSLPKWNTLDVTVGKSFDTGNAGTVTMKLAARNILNERYELSSGYPMPGASVTAGLEYRF